MAPPSDICPTTGQRCDTVSELGVMRRQLDSMTAELGKPPSPTCPAGEGLTGAIMRMASEFKGLKDSVVEMRDENSQSFREINLQIEALKARPRSVARDVFAVIAGLSVLIGVLGWVTQHWR